MVQSARLRFGRFVFDAAECLLFCEDERVPLSPKVLETLALLLERRGHVVSKQEFMQTLWPDTFVEESNLTQNIFILRKTLGTTDAGRQYVETVPKRGYRISTVVEEFPPCVVAAPAGVPTEVTSPPPPAMVPGMARPPAGPATNAAGPLPVLPTSVDAAALPSDPARRRLRLPIAVLGAGLLATAAVLLRLRGIPSAEHPVVAATTRLTDDGVPKNLGQFPSPLVTDGRWLYFTEAKNNQSLLARVPLEGGMVESFPAPFPDATAVDYSRSRGQLLIGSVWHTDDNRPLLAQTVAGPGQSPARSLQIGELTGHDANWSPHADTLAFARGRFLQLAAADGTNVRTLVRAPGVVYWPRWSPDGRLLRFSVNFGSNASEIWEVGADGKGLHQFTTTQADASQMYCGSWSADGRNFFYLSGGPGTNAVWMLPGARSPGFGSGLRDEFRAVVRSSPGTNPANVPIKLTTGQADLWRAPLPSADGRALYVIGSHQRGELMRLDPKTREFKPFLGGLSAEGVSFSPDGGSIAYTAYPEGTLWLARADGTERRRLTQPPVVARFPRWSPDGRTVAYVAGEAGSQWRLFLVDVANGQSRPMLPEDSGNQGVASWSPDGTRIAFGRLLDFGTARDPTLSIQIYDRVHGSRTTLHGSEGLWTPRWSPDGRFFTAVTEDNRTLRLYDSQATEPARSWTDLAGIGVNDVIWSPDSRFLFFDTVFGADPSIYRVRLSDHKLERWADLRGLHRGGFFEPWLGLDPTGAPLVLRDMTVEEVYRLSLEASR